MRRSRRAPAHPNKPIQLRLAGPLCAICGKAIDCALWAIVVLPEGREVLVHALRCFDAWREDREARTSRAVHPTTAAE